MQRLVKCFEEIFSIEWVKKLFLFSCLLAVASGCTRSEGCIAADDFGFAKAVISARYDPSVIIGTQANEVAPWVDPGFILSGNPVNIMVKNWISGDDSNNSAEVSAWCPWFGTQADKQKLSSMCSRLQYCRYQNGEMCDGPVIENAPCIMTGGVGLYALLSTPIDNPNETLSTMTNPFGITRHMGAPHPQYNMYDFSSSGAMHPAGGWMYNYDGDNSMNSSRLNYVNGKLYFKILDSYYDDNSGQYQVFVKSGLLDPSLDPISYTTGLVHQTLFGTNDSGDSGIRQYGVVRLIYQNIVANPQFTNAVRGMLTLFITITGVLFLMGTLEITQAELIQRVIKVAIIATLIDPNISWNFFNEYVLIWFYEGVQYIINILKAASTTGPGSTNLIVFLTSDQIMIKLSSLLFSTPTGWFYILVYFVMLFFILMVLFDAAILYMTGLVMVGLLISIAPIFIALYLFESTKSFFENWLKQLIGYAVQAILVTAGVLFMTMIIRNQIYNTLGFRACFQSFPSTDVPIFSWWFPEISSTSNAPALVPIPVPKAHFISASDAELGGNAIYNFDTTITPGTASASIGFSPKGDLIGNYCQAYECVGMRYPDLPFLDPAIPYEARQLNILREGDVTDFAGLFIIVICVYLLHHYNSSTVSIAKFLSGTTGNLGSNRKAASAAVSKFESAVMKPVNKLGNYIDRKTGFKGLRDGMHNFWENNVSHAAAKKWENYRSNKIRDEALEKGGMFGASGNIHKKVESKLGYGRKEALDFKTNKADYEKKMALSLRTQSGMDKDEAAALAKKLADGNSKEAQEALIKKLGAAKAAAVMKDAGFKDAMNAKKKQENYQDEYLDTYKKMSSQGKGFLAKRVGFVEDYQNLKNDFKSMKDEENSERQMKGEKIMGAYDNMKSYLSGGLMGGENREMLYDDSRLRSHAEIMRDQEEQNRALRRQKALDEQTVAEGHDIQRPDFLANLRSEKSGTAAHYDDLIKESIKDDVQSQLRTGTNQVMGDTYIKEKMKDTEFNAMIKNVEDTRLRMKEEDTYIKQEFMYHDDPKAMAEIKKREAHIDEAINDEIARLKELRK